MSEANPELQQEVARLIVAALNLDLSPEEIQPEAPLYGEGLGLDSIDILATAGRVAHLSHHAAECLAVEVCPDAPGRAVRAGTFSLAQTPTHQGVGLIS